MSPETTNGTSLERRVLAGTGLQILARLVTAVASASAIVLIGHRLGDHELGVFFWHFTSFLIVGTLVDFGSMAIAVREATRHPEREQAVIRAVFRLRLRLILVCLAIYAIAAWSKEGSFSRARLPLLASLHLLALAPNVAAAWLQRRVQLTAIALAPILGYGLYLGSAAWLAASGVLDPGAYLVAFGVGVAVQSLVPWWAARRVVKLVGPVDPALPRALFLAMLPLGISVAVSTVYFRLDSFLLAQLVSDEATGRYARVFPLLSLSIALPAYLSAALFPAMTSAASKGTAPLLALARRACTVLGGFALPGAAIAFSWGAQGLWLLWARHGEAQPLAEFTAANGDLLRCLPWLSIAAVAIFLTYPQMHALTALGRQQVLAVVTLIGIVVKLALGWLLVRRYGVAGAAMATAGTELLVFACITRELRRATGGFAPSRALLRPAAVAIAVGVVAACFPRTPPLVAIGAAILLLAVAVRLGGALPLKIGVDA